MDETLPEILWRQFGSALQMLENAVLDCPPEVWGDEIGPHEFWYLTFHTLFWLDFYGSESSLDFRPPAPYTLTELDPAGLLPERVYSKAELLTYLEFGREKSRRTIRGMTPEKARQPFACEFRTLSLLELALSNMRHVQHHTAQLNLLLRQQTDSAPRWVSRPEQPLNDPPGH